MASRTAQHTAQIFTDPFSSARNNAKHDKERKRDALYLRPHQRPIQRSRDIHRPSFNSYGPSSHSGDRLDHPARPRHASLPADFVSSSFGLGKASGSGFDGRYPNHPSSSHSKLHRQSTPVQSGFESSRDRTPPQPIREHLYVHTLSSPVSFLTSTHLHYRTTGPTPLRPTELPVPRLHPPKHRGVYFVSCQ